MLNLLASVAVLNQSPMEYYSAFKKKEILSQATTWMSLEDILLREINQSQKDTYCMMLLI